MISVPVNGFNNKIDTSKEKHPFHLVTRSPWPFLSSCALFAFTLSLVLYFHKFSNSLLSLKISLASIGLFATAWWEDVIEESTFEGNHTEKVLIGLKLGMILFIVSEIMLFFSFFWAFFYASISVNSWVSTVWPPLGVETIKTWGLPFSNTLLLLYTGASITIAHKGVLKGSTTNSIRALLLTLIIGLIFVFIQISEYIMSAYTINDSSLGSSFFLLTGLHGLHVLAGAIFLLIAFIRLLQNHFTENRHFGYEAAIWYWHFVDVVWVVVFLFVYWWGGTSTL